MHINAAPARTDRRISDACSGICLCPFNAFENIITLILYADTKGFVKRFLPFFEYVRTAKKIFVAVDTNCKVVV